ncbi:hypothetical protein EBN03_17270 [Nocardia stercoris]|uniref:Secreted protein n=2 Tax=Nocardia stercoris TaxID=2483361 RepID=A0A3M2L7U9_9NOCA|nr:hypothetical protein EBN03_17270 [Nocardia stercoris]
MVGLLLFLCAPTVSADAPAVGGDVSVAQTLGERELTVILRRVVSVPGPLQVEVVTHAGTAAGKLTVAAIPVGVSRVARTPAPGAVVSQADLELRNVPGDNAAALRVDRPGPWELTVSDGTRTARIPFLVPAQTVSPPERLVYGGFVVAGLLLPVALVVAVRARPVWALLPVGGMIAGVAVAVTAAVLSASLPLPPQPGVQLDPGVDDVSDPYALGHPLSADFSRPPVLLGLAAGTPVAGRSGTLRIDLSDSATGAPVDDLVVHDDALVHLLIVGPGGELWHLHPIRTASARYEIDFTPTEPGHYALGVELARRGGGVQSVRVTTGFTAGPGSIPALSGVAPSAGRFPRPPGIPAPGTVAPGAPAGTAAPGAVAGVSGAASGGGNEVPDIAPLLRLGSGGTATTEVAGTSVQVRATNPVAGVPATVTAHFGDTPDLQPWLGMLGHMIVVGPLGPDSDIAAAAQSAPVWGHAHSMGSGAMPDMPGMGEAPGESGRMLMQPTNGDSMPDETVAAYGPDVPFTFTFPVPGHYRLWIQAERHYTILTVPVEVDVAAVGAS